ncbi:UNVERIFIED_CONTAM: hypothetical protein Scaly_3114600 [Sesamum calycinum]|uniref:Uncharacterized protein n=1 Tax=Sesamum calycinum TaxID=2727403 RepID=A0AAW2JKF1_9LAMI
MREHLLAALQFQEGHLPLRYLGLPLLASRLSLSDCQPLLLKIDSRIKGWDSIQLSFAGRLQLIKSVLMSLNVYWAMAFILPKGVIRAVEKRMRHFLWKGNSAVGYPKVAWSEVSRPMEEGGLGIRDILALNKALMSRHLWKGGSWGWRKLLRLRSALLPYIEFKVGNGELFSIWHDPWHSLGTLIRRFPSGPSRTNISIAAKLSTVIVDGDWRWPPITDMECIEILHLLPTIHSGSDSILWRGGELTTTVAYGIFRTPGPMVGWYPLLSGPVRYHGSRLSYGWLSLVLSEVYPRLEGGNSLLLAEPCMGSGYYMGFDEMEGQTHCAGGLQSFIISYCLSYFGGNVTKESFGTLSARAPLLLALR